MLRLQRLATSYALTVVAMMGLGIAWPSYSLATSVYTFTYTGSNVGIDGTEQSLTGSFSIPIADFGGQPASLPNTDITALSFTGNSYHTFFNPISATETWATPDIYTLFSASVVFTYIGAIPQVEEGTANLAQNSGGYDVFIGCCNTGFSYPGTFGPTTAEMNHNQWVTTSSDLGTTPLPAALPLFLAGLGGLGLLGWRRKRS
jgi:hypothetical protein